MHGLHDCASNSLECGCCWLTLNPKPYNINPKPDVDNTCVLPVATTLGFVWVGLQQEKAYKDGIQQ